MDREGGWSVSAGGVVYDRNSGGISWNAEDDVLTIEPSPPFTRSSEVQVSLSGFAARADGCPPGYDEDQPLSFTVSSQPTMSYTPGLTQSEAVWGVPTDTPVEITFSEPMDQSAGSAEINGVPYTSAGGSWSGNKLSITPAGLPSAAKIDVSLNNFAALADGMEPIGVSSFSYSTRWNTNFSIRAHRLHGTRYPER